MTSFRRPVFDALVRQAISIWSRLIRPFRRLPRERAVPLVTLAALSVLLLALIMYERSQAPAPWTFPQEIEQTSPAENTDGSNPATTPQGTDPRTGGNDSAAGIGDPTAFQDNAEPVARIQAEDRLVWPADGPRSKSFGWVFSETYQDYRHHPGIDFKVPVGTSVRAALTGVVLSVDSGSPAGTAIVLDHQDGRRTLYSGLKQAKVDVGDKVKQGQVIGQVGEPGEGEIGDGPHLHFELSRDGEPADPVSLFKR